MVDLIRLEGHIKEHLARKIFNKAKLRHFSPDWICWKNNTLEFIEVKYKPKFEAGTNFKYDGQGLDYREYKNYIEVFKKFKIRTMFIIYDSNKEKTKILNIYHKYIDELYFSPEKYKFYSEKSKIIIFAFELFNKGEPYEQL